MVLFRQFLSLLAACLLLLLPSSATSNVIISSSTAAHSGSTSSAQQHRNLAGFVMPFQILWRFDIAEGPGFPDPREPTADEYEGIRQANMDWFDIEIPKFYAANVSDFVYREIDCVITETIYSPDAAEWPHQVIHACEVIWDADTIGNLPTVSRFLTDMSSSRTLLDSFVTDHLRSADPQDPRSIFQFASRVGYVTNNLGTTSPLPTDDTAAPTEGAPPTQAPVVAPTTVAPVVTTEAPVAPTEAPVAAPVVAPTGLPQQKEAPPPKCGSLAGSANRGGAAAAAKDCDPGRRLEEEQHNGRRKRKLKGSSNL